MSAHSIPRFLLVGLMVAIIGGAIAAPAAASPAMEWSDSVGEEGVLVQPCAGFDITSNYAADRMFDVDYGNSQIVARQRVSFAGTLENTTSGQSAAYEGHFTRTGSPTVARATISDLTLRLDLNTTGDITVTLSRVDIASPSSPPEVIRALFSNVLRMDLCGLLGGPAIVDNVLMPNQGSGPESCDIEPFKGYTCPYS
jgi:hypothetical protein